MEEYILPLVTPCAYHDPNFLPPSEADDAYAYLLANTPWEKTPKINRWVTLMELPPPPSTKVEEEEAEEEEGRGNNNGSSSATATATTTTTTTAAATSSSGYRYRDAPGGSVIGFPPVVHALKLRAEEWYNSKKDASSSSSSLSSEEEERVTFDVCLLNYYEDGNMRIGWHSDREEIGRTTPIASISLGATRKFLMRSRTDGARDRASVDMTNGSAIFMENACQHGYLHSVPHEPGVGGGRINLTFRCKTQPQRRRDAQRDGKGGNDGGGNGATTTTITSGEVDHERRDNWIHKISTEGGALDSTAGAWRGGGGGGGRGPDATTTTTVDDGDDAGRGGGVFGDSSRFHDPDDASIDYDVAASVRYVVRTNIGAESYCASEIEEVLSSSSSTSDVAIDGEEGGGCGYRVLARPFGIAGYVAVCRIATSTSGHDDDDDDDGGEEEDAEGGGELASSRGVEGALLRLRTAHHILRYHDHFELGDVLASASSDAMPEATMGRTNGASEEEEEEEKKVETNIVGSITGEMMYEYYKARLVSGDAVVSSLADLNEEGGGTFRTTCERIGCGHGFQAPEVEREVGGAMSEYYANVKPKMSDFDVQVRVDVVSTKVIVGTQINVDDLSKERHFLRFRNSVTIKTNLAYAMIRCANIKIGDLVVDPFCGSGTILLEALDVYQKLIKCVGMDVSRRSANGAQENARAEGFGDDICQFHCCDARNFRKKLEEESVNAIVTNLPWGVMTGHKNVSDLQSMYEVFLRTAWYILKDKARIVMLVLRGLQVTRIIRKLSGRYRLLSVNCVRTTNNLPSIVVVEKVAVDQVRGAVKRQLGYLAQFVSVSPEMYKAVHYEKIDETTF